MATLGLRPLLQVVFSEALVATATGLTVAIIALGFHSYCAAKVNDSVATLEHECGNILDAYNEEHDI